jgi:hypothetical protein
VYPSIIPCIHSAHGLVLTVVPVLFEAVEQWIPSNIPRFRDIMVGGLRPVPVLGYTCARLVKLCLVVAPSSLGMTMWEEKRESTPRHWMGIGNMLCRASTRYHTAHATINPLRPTVQSDSHNSRLCSSSIPSSLPDPFHFPHKSLLRRRPSASTAALGSTTTARSPTAAPP